jgi:hypothetical protein
MSKTLPPCFREDVFFPVVSSDKKIHCSHLVYGDDKKKYDFLSFDFSRLPAKPSDKCWALEVLLQLPFLS